MSRNFTAISPAVFFPTLSMPSAKIKLEKSTFLDASIALNKLSVLSAPKPSSADTFSLSSEYKSEKFSTPKLSYNCPAVIAENPSIFIPFLQAKFASLATTLGLQCGFGQNRFAPVSVKVAPQYGQTVGLITSLQSSVISVVPKISGITSLLRLISTLAPIFIFFRNRSP